jgi:single-strand DNA-binding protein
MASINDVTILGNLGADPELRFTNNGTAVATLSIATSRRWKDRDSDEEREVTEWHRVIVWGKSAEWVADNKRKGDQMLVKGHLQTRSYEVEINGAPSVRYTTEVVARSWDPFGGCFALYGEKPRPNRTPTPTDADAPGARARTVDGKPSFRGQPDGTVGGRQTVGPPSTHPTDEYVPVGPGEDDCGNEWKEQGS